MFGRSKSWWTAALLLLACDVLSVAASHYLALAIRFEALAVPAAYLRGYLLTLKAFTPLCVLVYLVFRLYSSIWRFASYHELVQCVGAAALSVPLHWLILTAGGCRMPLSYLVFGAVFQLGGLMASRFASRLYYLELSNWTKRHGSPGRRVHNGMLIGAGSAGQLILRDLSTSSLADVVMRCVIDDDPAKRGLRMDGVPVVGGRGDIPECVRRYGIDRIFLAIPTAGHAARREILSICQGTGCEVKLLPGFYQFANGEVSLSDMREVDVADLLDRAPVSVSQEEIAREFAGRRVLVTGGGGSIGTELCKQLAAFRPASLTVLDNDANRIYYLQEGFAANFPGLDFAAELGSVCDHGRLRAVFDRRRPDVVFHAAAHKQVPLLESCPGEAVRNNLLGTYNAACAAVSHGCRKFILLSTDKAVNPTSVLGVTSRVGEMLMQVLEHLARSRQLRRLFPPFGGADPGCATEFASVRFGSVFDSQGSAMGLFKHQIAAGGPVLVTHREATRFCMSTAETARLLLQAACYARDGEVFVLDMGKPFRIDDLARRLIRLSGFEPDRDIKVEYTGLRPGEKLREEPLMFEEGMRKTPNPSIYVANPVRLDIGGFLRSLEELFRAVDGEDAALRDRLAALVKSYHQVSPDSAVFIASQLAQPQEPLNALETVAQAFVRGDVTAVVPLDSGYINRTYRVDAVTPSGGKAHALLQRINTGVFPKPDDLMENFALVTAHLAERLRLPGRAGVPSCPTLVPTRGGRNFLETPSGAWRMTSFFEAVHSYDIPENPEVFRQAGAAFGAFLQAMTDFPPERLHEVIPNFHDTWSRYQDLERAIERDAVGRVAQVAPEIEFVRARTDLFKKISEPLEKGEIPRRIGHNDCNLNNILFDDKTNLPVAIVDLDTVMPSSPLYDFGDSMRIGTNTARDDEKDLSKVSCDLSLYEQYAAGWLASCGGMLTPKELELLPCAALVITAEDGIRFLMDHISGDTYYYIFYLGQNLDRARTQFALLADMEKKLPQMQNIILKIRNEELEIRNLS